MRRSTRPRFSERLPGIKIVAPREHKRHLMRKNTLRRIRESLLMSKAELAKKANVSPITIARIENGMPCRMETKRKIILALGYDLSEKDKIFGT
jgi:DNA-binding XRE family transcriptional regulator